MGCSEGGVNVNSSIMKQHACEIAKAQRSVFQLSSSVPAHWLIYKSRSFFIRVGPNGMNTGQEAKSSVQLFAEVQRA